MSDKMKTTVLQNNGLFARQLITRAESSMFKARRKILIPNNISPRQADILFFLYSLGHKVTLVELAQESDRAINTLSVQMNKLQNNGLVHKTKDKPKSKLLSFELTEKGLDTIKGCNKTQADEEIMSILSDEERRQLILSLQKIIINAGEFQLRVERM